MLKLLKWTAMTAGGVLLAGSLIFGRELYSYVHTSAVTVQDVVKDSVPLEFELRRARDLLDDVIPEMHANIRLVAQQEVEITRLKSDIEQSGRQIQEQRTRVVALRQTLDQPQVKLAMDKGQQASRVEVADELSRRFDMLKEAEIVLAGKQKLLAARETSLGSAMRVLEKARSRKALLEGDIATLESKHKLIQLAAADSGLKLSGSKLAQTERLIGSIRKQLDVAERVLAHESRFVESPGVTPVDEKELRREVDEHLAMTKAH